MYSACADFGRCCVSWDWGCATHRQTGLIGVAFGDMRRIEVVRDNY